MELYKVITIIFGHFLCSRVSAYASGGAMNPTIAIGLEFVTLIHDGTSETLGQFYIYIIGPYIGGMCAGLWYKYIHRPSV